jgi:hypothetical protein
MSQVHKNLIHVHAADTIVIVGRNFFGLGEISDALPTVSMRLGRTTPEDFAQPWGKNVDLEFNRSRADSQALAATTKVRARIRCSSRIALSM